MKETSSTHFTRWKKVQNQKGKLNFTPLKLTAICNSFINVLILSIAAHKVQEICNAPHFFQLCRLMKWKCTHVRGTWNSSPFNRSKIPPYIIKNSTINRDSSFAKSKLEIHHERRSFAAFDLGFLYGLSSTTNLNRDRFRVWCCRH